MSFDEWLLLLNLSFRFGSKLCQAVVLHLTRFWLVAVVILWPEHPVVCALVAALVRVDCALERAFKSLPYAERRHGSDHRIVGQLDKRGLHKGVSEVSGDLESDRIAFKLQLLHLFKLNFLILITFDALKRRIFLLERTEPASPRKVGLPRQLADCAGAITGVFAESVLC